MRPAILGALFDAVSAALRNLPKTKLDTLPRMADFAMWVSAAESALGLGAGAFMRGYANNRNDANSLALGIFFPLQGRSRNWWTNSDSRATATDLLKLLNQRTGNGDKQRRTGRLAGRRLASYSVRSNGWHRTSVLPGTRSRNRVRRMLADGEC